MDTKRFNNPEYKKQIRAIRNYRRQPKAAPETASGKFFQATGLDSWRNRIFTVLAIALLVYLAYFAKFLQFKGIEVYGANPEVASDVIQNFNDYIGTYRGHILPQKNILFFSKTAFKNYLLSNNLKIGGVGRIKLVLPHQVAIEVVQRVPEYVLEAGTNSYILNTDSTVGAQIAPENLEQLTNQYKIVKDTADEQINPGEKFLSDQRGAFVERISKDTAEKLQLQIASYEVPGRASDQLILNIQNGFKVYFLTSSDEPTYFQRFYTLWLQLNPDQRARLAYFDFRFEKNAYSCNKGDPCAK